MDRITSSSAKTARPNILFIITDQQSADLLSARMGRRYLHTPAMDSLAERGTLYTRAYSTNPLCVPWRNCVFTGRFSHQTGITDNAFHARLDPAHFQTLGHHLAGAGYTTAYSGKWHLAYDENDPDSHGFEILRADRSGGPDKSSSDAAIEFLRRDHDKPFLLVASYLNPHNICEWARRLAGRQQRLNCGEIGQPPVSEQLPPAPFNLEPQRGEPDGLALMRRSYQVDDGIFPVAHFTEEDWRRHRWGYYRMVELVDREIGRLLDALRARGLEDSTVIFFTSDHGDCAGAHRWNQKTVLFDESARVPLIVCGPGITRGTTDRLVNTGIDLLPTMMAAAQMDVPHDLPGKSLLSDASPDYIVAQSHMTQGGAVDGTTPTLQGRMVRSKRYKYCIYSSGQQRESLVDMDADPGECVNLATDPTYRPILLQHREMLTCHGKQHADPLVEQLLADAVRPVPFAAPVTNSAGG